MADRVRWASRRGRRARFATGLGQLDDAEVVAVASHVARADAFGDRFGVPHRHATYEPLAADPDVDVVFVATPHVRHEADTLSAGTLDAVRAQIGLTYPGE